MYRKRERTQNWTLEEKMYLLELVKSRLDVLENKRIDSASSAMKGMAWQDIHAGFAARFGNDRDAHRVREQWRRMKGQSRTEMLEFAERVRSFGSEIANQRRPSSLAEEVWKTLELARRLNSYHQQAYGGSGDDVGSPLILDDDEEDGDDSMLEPDVSCVPLGGPEGGPGHGHGHGGDRNNGENGIKLERLDLEAARWDDRLDGRLDGRYEHDGHLEALLDAVQEAHDAHDAPHRHDGEGMSPGRQGGLVGMLRPKVELNDVPELDTSMVPSGLSITAVKIGGGQKRRLVERMELPGRNNSWEAQQAGQQGTPTASGTAAARVASPAAPPSAPAAPVNFNPASLHESKRLEHRRRLEMMEAEHSVKMELLRVEKETAEVRRRIALRDEASALTCRSCGADRDAAGGQRPSRHSPAASAAPSSRTALRQAQESANKDAGHDPDDDDAVSDSASSPALNGAKEEEEEENEDGDGDTQDQVRFAGGEPGSGAGKGGGSGGSIRDAGGSMGKREAALEEEYFYKQQKEQLKKLKTDLTDEIGFHEEQIKRHQEAIARHKQRVNDLDKDK